MKQRSRLWAGLVLTVFSVEICPQLLAQSAQAVLASAAAAFSPSPVHSVTLTARAQWIAGSHNESGNATLTANADGSFTMLMQFSQGARTEAQTSFASGQTCTWAGADGNPKPVAPHNCMSSMNWFLPLVSLFGGQQLAAVNTVFASSGSSTRFLDIQQSQAPPSSLDADSSALLTRLTKVDLYLDPTTYLPSIIAFNLHPDNNAAADIPVQVIFTNYQTVGGVNLPFRITRYLNGALNLDLTVTQASTN